MDSDDGKEKGGVTAVRKGEAMKSLENLHKLGIIDDDTKLEEHSTIIMDPAYVHINTETEKMVQQFKAEEEKNGIYTIGRYGAWTYCSMEDCMIAARDLAMSLCQG